jgi:hypothetical protein
MRRLPRIMFGAISLGTWSVIYQVAGYILIGSLAIGFVATTATFMAGNKISSDLTTRLTTATQTAGEANAQAGAANERAAALEADAAKSRERTAALEVEAGRLAIALQTAQAETQKIEQAAAWRVISPDSRARLISNLAHGPGGSVELSYSANDSETLFLASQLETMFTIANAQAGGTPWHVAVQPRLYSRAIFWDLRIIGQNDHVVRSMWESFSTANIPYLTEGVPNVVNDSAGMIIGGIPPSDVMIFVGPKRPPN